MISLTDRRTQTLQLYTDVTHATAIIINQNAVFCGQENNRVEAKSMMVIVEDEKE